MTGHPIVYVIGSRVVTRAQFNRHGGRHRLAGIRRGQKARARKAAILAHRPLIACWHDWTYHEDWIGDPGVVNGTATICWLKCSGCRAERPASYDDRPGDDDW